MQCLQNIRNNDMSRSIFILFWFISIAWNKDLNAQYLSSQSYNLGALIGFGASNGPAVDESALFSQGSYHVRSTALAFTFNFSSVSKRKGISLGPVFSASIGGSKDKYIAKNLGAGWSNIDGIWREDFSLVVDLKVGFAVNYVIPDREASVGLRYFNWYQANSFGATYGNADDAAAIGIAANWKRFGLSYSFGSAKIPGVLVNSHLWNSSEIEARYQLVYNKDTKGGMIIGVRNLTQKLMESTKIGITPQTIGNCLNFFVLFH
jgi:hypothetical protein